MRRNTVDILGYAAKTIVQEAGLLYIGDTLADNVYNVLSGFDDDEFTIENYWIGNDEKYGTEALKKVKRLRIKGLITRDQILEVYLGFDGGTPSLVGTIRGDGSYIDYSQNYTIGSSGIGESILGGEVDDSGSLDGSPYLIEIKTPGPKFRKRAIKLVATGIGYVNATLLHDFDIRLFRQKLPSANRLKQNVSLDGASVDQ